MIEFRRIDFESDLETCLAFRKDSFICSFPGSDEWKDRWNPDHYSAHIRNFAKKYPFGVVHVWSGDEIIGQLEFEYGASNGHVYLFYLRPDVRGTEAATLIHEYVVSELKKAGCNTASLRVSPTNTRAVAYYKKHGWQDQGQDLNRKNVHTFRRDL